VNQSLLETSDEGAEGQEEAEIADPATIEDNVLFFLQRMNEQARVFKKLFKKSAFDREAQDRIGTAFDRTIQKLRSAKAAITR
jgi:hypothetical protein